MGDFRTGMSGACMSVKYLKTGILPKHVFVDPLDGSGWTKYVPERTCNMVPKVLRDDEFITHVAFSCSFCGKGRNFPTICGFIDEVGTAEHAINNPRKVGYCEDCGAKVVD